MSLNQYNRWDHKLGGSTNSYDTKKTVLLSQNSKNKNSEFDTFKKEYNGILSNQDCIEFCDVWDHGMSCLESRTVDDYLKHRVAGMMLNLLDFFIGPEHYDNYQGKMGKIYKKFTSNVQVWHFFENSRYYFNCLSSKKSDLGVSLFKIIWNDGAKILKNDKVNESSKSDVAERMLLIAEASDPDIIIDSSINISEIIDNLYTYVNNDIFIQRLKDYDFSFESFEKPVVFIRNSPINDDFKSICDGYKIIDNPLDNLYLHHSNVTIYAYLFFLIAVVIILSWTLL